MNYQPLTTKVSTTKEVKVSYENERGGPITLDQLSRFVNEAIAAGFAGDTKILKSPIDAFLTYVTVKRTEKS